MGENWRRARERAVERLRRHIEEGLVDPDIVNFLSRFNEEKECAFTTSSCSGRVVVLEGGDFFDKKSAVIREAWHDPGECLRGITKYCGARSSEDSYMWVSLQPPILHIVVDSAVEAEEAVRCAMGAGFSRACYHGYRAGGYHVELAAQDKMHIPLPAPCKLLSETCRILARFKERLARLEECLMERLCGGDH